MHAFFSLPTPFVLFLSQALAAGNVLPTALRKLPPDASEKLFPDHLAFAPLPILDPHEAVAAANSFLADEDEDVDLLNGTNRFHPAYAIHVEDDARLLHRAAQAMGFFEGRQACPVGMNSCSDIGSPDKCCQQGTYCVAVQDSGVGQVACCPNGSSCGGGVGSCPADATSCPADLGGGCCIPGYICQGVGCVPSSVATSIETVVQTSTQKQGVIITTTQTTTIQGSPSTVVVTLIVTESPTVQPTTQTSTQVVTATSSDSSEEDTATGGAPWRPTSSSFSTSSPEPTKGPDTQRGCPVGFYGCLATHGGGCCRTDRDCETYSCPAPSTTIISNGLTIVILESDLPSSRATSTCASGWFLCGADAGPVAGCCPSGYECGTASCFTVEASRTAEVQKVFPSENSAVSGAPVLWLGGIASLLSLLVLG